MPLLSCQDGRCSEKEEWRSEWLAGVEVGVDRDRAEGNEVTIEDEPHVVSIEDGSRVVSSEDRSRVVSIEDEPQVVSIKDEPHVVSIEDGSRVVSRCSVCDIMGRVMAFHSQNSAPPDCPPTWESLWEGFSHLAVSFCLLANTPSLLFSWASPPPPSSFLPLHSFEGIIIFHHHIFYTLSLPPSLPLSLSIYSARSVALIPQALAFPSIVRLPMSSVMHRADSVVVATEPVSGWLHRIVHRTLSTGSVAAGCVEGSDWLNI